MKYLISTFAFLFLLACNDDEEALPYTGNEVSFDLEQSSQFPIEGIVTILERRDANVEIRIELTGTDGDIQHPTHLHFGDVSTPDAEIAQVLTPVDGQTGESITIFSTLNDESAITYTDLLTFDGHIKVHQDGGPNKSTILASGNIGSAFTKNASSGRQKVAVCKSE